MTTRGIHGILTDGVTQKPCLLIGELVPRIHHSDGIPVYVVIEHDRGIPIVGKDKRLRNLLAYPSHYPGPGQHAAEEWIYATHELLPWEALLPCFFGWPDSVFHKNRLWFGGPILAPENMTEVCDRLNLPLPPKL